MIDQSLHTMPLKRATLKLTLLIQSHWVDINNASTSQKFLTSPLMFKGYYVTVSNGYKVVPFSTILFIDIIILAKWYYWLYDDKQEDVYLKTVHGTWISKWFCIYKIHTKML